MDVDIRDAFFDRVYEIAAKDPNVIFLTSDMDAFSLKRYKEDFPKRFINIGVAEQNMVTIATGLALSGKKVYMYAILSFITMRCYEQIKFNICSMNLPITLVGVGTGLSFDSDGPSHHGVGDLGILRMLPEMTILNPSTPSLTEACAQIAYEQNSPVCVRLDKGRWPDIHPKDINYKDGMHLLREGTDICIIATGLIVHRALEAAEELTKYSIKAAVIDLYCLKPVNEQLLLELTKPFTKIVTVEENSIIGGLGSIISDVFANRDVLVHQKRIALKDEQLLRYGKRDWFHQEYEIDLKGIVDQISTWVANL